MLNYSTSDLDLLIPENEASIKTVHHLSDVSEKESFRLFDFDKSGRIIRTNPFISERLVEAGGNLESGHDEATAIGVTININFGCHA